MQIRLVARMPATQDKQLVDIYVLDTLQGELETPKGQGQAGLPRGDQVPHAHPEAGRALSRKPNPPVLGQARVPVQAAGEPAAALYRF